ncbi:MAG: YkgJ family cysteine cluster protein [Desulfobacteraceae bacterium]
MDSKRTYCIRCGECCRSGSPSLQMEDVGLVIEGVLRYGDLYTVRRGEVIRDNVRRGLAVAREELVKIKEITGGEGPRGCIFYDPEESACRIYENRPIQCRALACWDPSEFMRVFRRPKADRADLIQEEDLRTLVYEHESRCSYPLVERAVKQINSRPGSGAGDLIELIRFDHWIRWRAAAEKGLPEDALDFLFGRPLARTISMFGLELVDRGDGSKLLRPMGSNSK